MLASGRRVGLVFTGVVLPGQTDGLALARIIKKKNSDLPVVLTTGFSRVFETEPEFPVLRKPYQISALGRAIGEALNTHREKRPAPAG